MAASPMAGTNTDSATGRFEKPGLRSPIAGYMGHVPGMIALNMHGGVWRDLVVQDPQLHRTAAATVAESRLRPKSARAEYTSPRVSGGNFQRPWSAQASKPGLSALGPDALTGKLGSESSETNFMPRMDKQWAPPVVGYGGHVPGYASGNLHGSPWKDLLTPTRKEAGVASRRISSPSRPPKAAGGGGSVIASPRITGPLSPKLPNNIKGYLEKHKIPCTPRSPSRTPRSAC